MCCLDTYSVMELQPDRRIHRYFRGCLDTYSVMELQQIINIKISTNGCLDTYSVMELQLRGSSPERDLVV